MNSTSLGYKRHCNENAKIIIANYNYWERSENWKYPIKKTYHLLITHVLVKNTVELWIYFSVSDSDKVNIIVVLL